MADFLYDDFFSTEDDPGVVVPIKIKGKTVPITLRRGLSVAERAAAETACVKRSVGPNGQMVVSGIDESKLVEEVLLLSILDWPFTTKDGEKVPVTRENIRRLRGGAEQIAKALQTIEEQGEQALAPFEPASDEA
jgi:hypothetical protein